MKKIYAGRRASDEERQFAQDLVDSYRALHAAGAFTEQGMPTEDGGVLRVNPNILLFALERLAKTGYLRPVESVKSARTLMALLMYSSGERTAGDRLELIAQALNTTTSTVERMLGHKD